MLKSFWPSGGKGHIIVTSRNPYLAEYRASGSVQVSPLNLDDSLSLFYDIVGVEKRKRHNSRVGALLEEWRGVPLAIHQMGSYIQRLELDLDKFVKLYTRIQRKLLRQEKVYEEYPHSIATAFATQQLDKNAKAALEIFCFFDPDGIPSDLIESAFDETDCFHTMDSICE